jgi:curved DNA-binding protein CbpA
MREASLDPYRELGISRTADAREIRTAYLAKARLHHPDNGGTVRAMARVNAAYELLRDSVERAAYDTSPEVRVDETRRAERWTGAAGPPPGRPVGPVLDFGIFAGWSIGEIARRDPGYLEWLAERREGEPFLEEIAAFVPVRENRGGGRRPGRR